MDDFGAPMTVLEYYLLSLTRTMYKVRRKILNPKIIYFL